MKRNDGKLLLCILLASCFVVTSATESMAQQRRYEPSTPTVSPYLQLFNNNGRQNRGIPNYYLYVRPLQQQQSVNQAQQRMLQQQRQTIGQLETNVQTLERNQAAGLLVAPTGHGSWFNRPSTQAGYLNTSRYYAQSGTLPNNSQFGTLPNNSRR